jgi:hypothetical protein
LLTRSSGIALAKPVRAPLNVERRIEEATKPILVEPRSRGHDGTRRCFFFAADIAFLIGRPNDQEQ